MANMSNEQRASLNRLADTLVTPERYGPCSRERRELHAKMYVDELFFYMNELAAGRSID
jgi:hypothetical protein